MMEVTPGRAAYDLDSKIVSLIIVPDGKPEDATPLQGFALSLCMTSWAIRLASLLPTDIFEPTPEGRETLLARRMSGTYPVHWHGQSPTALRAQIPPPFAPYIVIFLPPNEKVADYDDWARQCPVRPTFVAEEGGDLLPDEMTLEGLKARFLKVLEAMPDTINRASIEEHRAAIAAWEPMPLRDLGYKIGGHNSVMPNAIALSVAGFDDFSDGPFTNIKDGNQPYIDQVVRTATTILDERDKAGQRDIQRIYRLMPDVNLFAPATYPDFEGHFDRAAMTLQERKIFALVARAIKDQRGYAHHTTTPAQTMALFGVDPEMLRSGKAEPAPHPLMMVRSMELTLATDAAIGLAASEFSSVLRLPNEVNRTLGTVRSFAELYRSRAPTSRKRLLAFRQVQARLAGAVPPEFVDLVRRSKDGVRIIADAHLEWLDVDGLPLMLRKTSTRIPATPGNLFVQMIGPARLIHLSQEAFRKVLVLSALAPDDPIAGMFDLACEGFAKRWKGQLELEVAPVASAHDMVEAINGFDGAMIVFDGHGGHEKGEPGKLFLRGTEIDVWSLRDRIKRIAPIVLLSACDTHAADRNHATTANGFITLGARTVISSVFPLGGMEGGIFAARLLYRVAEYLPAALKAFDQGLRWSDVVAGMLQMQAATDFLRLLLHKNLLDEKTYEAVHMTANMAINGGADDPFGVVLDELVKLGHARAELLRDLELAIANSDVISYLQIGRPETILIDDANRVAAQLADREQFEKQQRAKEQE